MSDAAASLYRERRIGGYAVTLQRRREILFRLGLHDVRFADAPKMGSKMAEVLEFDHHGRLDRFVS